MEAVLVPGHSASQREPEPPLKEKRAQHIGFSAGQSSGPSQKAGALKPPPHPSGLVHLAEVNPWQQI